MTANQLKAQENELKREELAEKKRTGKAERFSKFTKGTGDLLKGAAGLAGAINDPSWYNLDKALVNDVGQLPYGRPIGLKENRNGAFMNTGGSTTSGDANKLAFPGVMRLEYVPTVGDGSQSESDAINVAMRNVYSFVRHANSGSRNYDAPDLMQYLLTMDSIYSLIAHCSRAYSIALTAKSENRYWPDKMLDAAGFTSGGGSIMSRLAQFRAEINMAIQKASIFNVPAKFPYFNRHIWMNSNIFKDGAYKRSRNYVFVPATYYPSPDINGIQTGIRYFGLDSNGLVDPNTITGWVDPTGLVSINDVRHMSYDAAVALLKYLIDNATQNEDYGIMSGDILKAFGDSGLFKLQQVAEDYHVEAIYSPEVLTQIQGATILPGSYYGPAVAQTSNGIIYQGTYGLTGGIHTPTLMPGILGYYASPNASHVNKMPDCKRVLINMYKDEVTPDDNMVATRLSNVATAQGMRYWDISGTSYYFYESKAETCASEIVDGVAIFNALGGADASYISSNFPVLNAMISRNGCHFTGAGLFIQTGTLVSCEEALRVIQTINAFEWAPRIVINHSSSPTNVNPNPIYENQDLANYILIGKDEIDQLHAVALLSLFAVPLLGNTVRKY